LYVPKLQATADMVDDRQNNDRQNFPEYLRDYLINRFGNPSTMRFRGPWKGQF